MNFKKQLNNEIYARLNEIDNVLKALDYVQNGLRNDNDIKNLLVVRVWIENRKKTLMNLLKK